MKNKFLSLVKSDNLLGTLLILFLIVFVLSWLLVPGSYMDGTYQASDAIKPIGLFDLISIPILTMGRAFHIAFFVLMVGGFYGILNQISIYHQLINNMAKKLADKVVIVVSIIFLVLSAFSGNMFLLFLLAPFFISVIMRAYYDRLTAFAATIGAMLVGTIVAPMHSLFLSAFEFYYDYSYTNFLVAKIVVFWMITLIYVYWINKHKRTVAKDEIPLLQKSTNKKVKSEPSSSYIFVFISAVFFVFLAIVMFDWYHAFGIETFQNISMQIERDSLLGMVLGRFEQFGYWGSYDLIVMMIVYLMLLIYIFQVTWRQISDGFLWGVRQVIKPAVYMLLTLVFYYFISNIQGQENLYYTLVSYVTTIFGEGSLASYAGVGLLSTIFYNNVGELVETLTRIIPAVEVGLEPLIPLAIQIFYAIGLLFVPTSLYLVGGLTLLNIPYFDWLKYACKVLLLIGLVCVSLLGILVLA